MNKYKNAIYEYELRRQNIINLTGAIGDASGWFDEITGNSGLNCTNLVKPENGFLPDTCIERYWKANKEALRVSEETYELVEPKKVHLCESCTLVDQLVQERKSEKQMFGIAKRRLSAIGKTLIKGMK